LYITILSLPSEAIHPSPVSPNDNSSPSNPASSLSSGTTAFVLPSYWTTHTLTELKIHLRDKRPGKGLVAGWVGVEESRAGDEESTVEGMGQNDGTVRFLWDREVAA